MNLEKYLQDNYNYNPDAKDLIKSYIKQWQKWYEGNVKDKGVSFGITEPDCRLSDSFIRDQKI